MFFKRITECLKENLVNSTQKVGAGFVPIFLSMKKNKLNGS